MFQKIVTFSFLFLLCHAVTPTWAQNKAQENAYQQQWQKVDSLFHKDMPQSAEKVIKDLLQAANQNDDPPNVMKAQLYLMQIARSIRENTDTSVIKQAERLIAGATGVEKAMWESITAQLYQNFYQENRYKILSRTTLEKTISDDIRTWDAAAFFNKISVLYQASIKNSDPLKKVSLKTYAPLVDEGRNTIVLRPTIFDLLAFRAIDFFENEESGIILPSSRFTIDDPVWFADAKAFAHIDLPVRDSLSFQYQALKCYQEVIAFHLTDRDPAALIDADLLRLSFVYRAAVMMEKDSIYSAALTHLANKYPEAPARAEVLFQIAQQQLHRHSAAASDVTTRDLPAIRSQLEQIVAQYPGTEGGIHAYNLLQGLLEKSLSVQTEEVNLPNDYSKALLSYRNLSEVYLSIYHIPNKVEHDFNEGNTLAALEGLSPLKKWSQSLPGSEDMELHTTEVKIDPLIAGKYILVVAAAESLADTQNVVAATSFQVSNLSLITNEHFHSGAKAWVLDREKGYPVPDAHISFWKRIYHRDKRLYRWEKVSDTRSSGTGTINLPEKIRQQGYSYRMQVTSDGDTFCTSGGIPSFYRRTTSENESRIHTFFFTDRSIYRPGQTVYYKGIMVKADQEGHNNTVVANAKTTVTFYDVNRQRVRTSEQTTNDFGSFAGSFTAPEGGLTGLMSIRNASGSVSFSVEEYKRPKFYVDFDTLNQDVVLGQVVSARGVARAYAGNNVDGAIVKYRVVRRARFPYYWAYYRWGLPSSPQMEIANGTTTTAADGSFSFDFEAIPDPSVDASALPVFTYVVSVDITDVNGETQSGRQEIQVGYRSVEIVADIPEEATPAILDTIDVVSRNLNGIAMPMDLHVRVVPLKFPGKIYKKRLWPVPDKFVMAEEEFRRYFPDDEYKNESDWHYWPEEKPVFEKELETATDGYCLIPRTSWRKSGWYVIVFTGKDTRGRPVVEKKYTYVVIPDGQPAALLKPFFVLSNKQHYQPGEKATLDLYTGFEGAYILQNSTLADTKLTVPLGNTAILNRTITEDDRGGLAFSWLYVYRNRTYTTTKILPVPWDNRALQIEWGTHRDKVAPGAPERWTMTIKGNKKETVAAELLAGMYDASLDLFRPHNWRWNTLLPGINFNPNWNALGFGAAFGSLLSPWPRKEVKSYTKIYPKIMLPTFFLPRRGIQYMTVAGTAESRDAAMPASPKMDRIVETQNAAPVLKEDDTVVEKPALPDVPVQIRKDFRETAFFFPQLRTDSAGNVQFSFTLPDALTTWKFMAFAHSKNWSTGYLEGKVKTQKDLMVTPNLPRFFRQGDQMILRAKISNLTDAALSGTATLEIRNALTMQVVDMPFHLKQNNQDFEVAPGRSTTAQWAIMVPESLYSPVIVQITAHAGNFTDGEENPVPVVTNRVLVTETLPLPMRGSGAKTFSFDKLKATEADPNKIPTLVNHALTVEYTGNPAWYAVQALPYLTEYPYDCAEQVFDRFYANALAGSIVEKSPEIEDVFRQWQHKDTAALLSNLEKNQLLKSALLEETPWVLEAKQETAAKHNIAKLFNSRRLSRELKRNLDLLITMQHPEGGFSWFKGMKTNRYITQYIITGMGKLQHLNVAEGSSSKAKKLVAAALPYLDDQITADYEGLVESRADLSGRHIGYIQVQYLYMRSFFEGTPIAGRNRKAFDYYRQQAALYWSDFNPYMKGMLALVFKRYHEETVADQIMASLQETAVRNEELGMYWKSMPHGYMWYQAPIEAHAVLIEAFSEVTEDHASVEGLKTWLLKQKQTQNWGNTRATADAVYALLLNGGNWLSYQPEVTIQLGHKTFHSSENNVEAGTAYFKKIIEGKDVRSEMGSITVTVKEPHDKKQEATPNVSWGAVYWQYFEDMDKVTAAATPLRLTKQLFVERNTPNGPILTEIKSGNELKVGDKVTVRLVLRVDRDMEYVHLKDMRAACFEPVNIISGYRYQGGLGYYESTKDISSNFFFDFLPKGTYVFEYPVFVSQTGAFTNGIATIQCMYAPEFSSHSKGTSVQVVP